MGPCREAPAQTSEVLGRPTPGENDYEVQGRDAEGAPGATVTCASDKTRHGARRLGVLAGVLAWWFVVTSGESAGQLVGPLATERGCEYIRALVDKYADARTSITSRCWKYEQSAKGTL